MADGSGGSRGGLQDKMRQRYKRQQKQRMGSASGLVHKSAKPGISLTLSQGAADEIVEDSGGSSVQQWSQPKTWCVVEREHFFGKNSHNCLPRSKSTHRALNPGALQSIEAKSSTQTVI